MTIHSIHDYVCIGLGFSSFMRRGIPDQATGACITALTLATCIVIYLVFRKKRKG